MLVPLAVAWKRCQESIGMTQKYVFIFINDLCGIPSSLIVHESIHERKIIIREITRVFLWWALKNTQKHCEVLETVAVDINGMNNVDRMYKICVRVPFVSKNCCT